MVFFYQISIYSYYLFVKIASFFNPKAKQWIKGRKGVFNELKTVSTEGDIYWFHCASLGEFEQGKPIIEKLKKKDKNIQILLTFFSPSGYKFGKSYTEADYVFYLPLDSSSNAKKFIELVKPKKAFFIKYEFWYHYLFQLHASHIPTYLVSGAFRKEQLFFKWYGVIHKKMLNYFSYFYVQNTKSKGLLNELGFTNVSVTGDTRLDRVYENSLNPDTPPLIKKFKGNKKIIIAGSSWELEEKILTEFIHSTKKDFKYIIAPHDIKPKHIKDIEELLGGNCIKYSEATYENISRYDTLIIDNVGILANTYQFTEIAYIGGGYTGALHNILEPASFGNVIFFGPKHKKFHEADDLLERKGAYEIKYVDDFIAAVNHLLIDDTLEQVQQINLNYVKENRGAADQIIKHLYSQ